MARLDPTKLSTEFLPYANETKPIIPRKYTLTHSDRTAELFLTISTIFACYKLNPSRDEVLAEWLKIDSQFMLYVYVQVDVPSGTSMSPIRYEIFRRELPLALEAIRYGDRLLFEENPILDSARIIIFFNSKFPTFNQIEDWGKLKDYK